MTTVPPDWPAIPPKWDKEGYTAYMRVYMRAYRQRKKRGKKAEGIRYPDRVAR